MNGSKSSTTTPALLTGTQSRVSKDSRERRRHSTDRENIAYGEAYAQGAVLVAFDINKSGPLEDIVDYSCASGVHSLIKSQLGEYLKYDADAKCRDRIPKNQDVCIQDNGDALYCEDDTDSSNSDDSNGGDDSDSDDNGDNGDNGSSASRANVLAIFRLIAKVLRVTGLLHNQ